MAKVSSFQGNREKIKNSKRWILKKLLCKIQDKIVFIQKYSEKQ